VYPKAHPLRSAVAVLAATSLLFTDIAPAFAQAQQPAPPSAPGQPSAPPAQPPAPAAPQAQPAAPALPAPQPTQPSANGQQPAPARTATITFEECGNLADPDIRARIKDLTESVLKREISQVAFGALVDKHWREARLSERIDIEVDEAIRAARAETTILDRAYSTISRETAEKTAIAVAERAYGSDGFRSALDDLAQGVARDFGAQIEGASGRVAGPVITCVKDALQSRYGGAIAQAFAQETQGNINITADTGSAHIGQGDLIIQGAGTIAGIVLIVSRRIIAQMVTNIGRRVAGLIASRVISTFTGLVGLALIVRDLYEASEGVFPLIAERMKSDESKNLIKEEITRSISADLNQQLSAIAEETADRIYSFWLDFKTKYATLLSLAEKSAAFAELLKNRKIDQLGRLGEIVALILRQEGEQSVFKRTDDGSLLRALSELDDNGVSIAVDTKSLDTAITWARRAGRRLQRVVDLGLHRIMAPSEITDKQLSTLLDIDDRNAAIRVAGLERGARDAILSLPPERGRELARRLTQDQLTAIAIYYTRLQPSAASRLMRAVQENPSVMESLANPSVQNSILRSLDQLGALEMLLRERSTLSIGNIVGDLELVREGQVHYRVFLERYWMAIVIILLFALLVLIWLKRAIFGRPAIVVKTADGGGGS
jgi:hypothetical protein